MKYKDKAIKTFCKKCVDIGLRKIEVARRVRKCHVCMGQIPQGEYHMALYKKPKKELNRFFKERTNTCMVCAYDIIQQQSIDLMRLHRSIGKYLLDNPMIKNRVRLKQIKDGTAFESADLNTEGL